MSKVSVPEPLHPAPWPDPTPEMLQSKAFEAIWQKIKRWDVNVPDVYNGYCGVTGNHVRAILDAIQAAGLTIHERTVPGEDQRRAGVGNKEAQDPAEDAEAAARERNRQKFTEERYAVLRQVTDVAMANEFLSGLEQEYANYSEVELKLVDPRTVTHIRRDQKQNLSEVMNAPAAIAIIVTEKNHTRTPVYYPLKIKPTPAQLGAIRDHFERQLGRGEIRLIGSLQP